MICVKKCQKWCHCQNISLTTGHEMGFHRTRYRTYGHLFCESTPQKKMKPMKILKSGVTSCFSKMGKSAKMTPDTIKVSKMPMTPKNV